MSIPSEDWISVKEQKPPIGQLVDCLLGHRRVVEPLIFQGRLWFTSDMKMYVYYEPTHWKPLKNNL